MSPTHRFETLAERYDNGLHYCHHRRLPPGYPVPQPTSCWAPGSLEILERFRAWLVEGGTSRMCAENYYLPAACHVFGLTLKPPGELDLDADLNRVLKYVQAKGCSRAWYKTCRNGLVKFRRFLRLERGLGEESHLTPFEPQKAAADLPAWLVSELTRHQHLQQRNWRPASHYRDIRSFWNKHLITWRFLCHERGVKQLAHLKRQHLLDYVDLRLESGRSVKTVNSEIRMLHTFLLFLQDEGYSVPQSLLRMPSLKEPDSLPKYLTDEQVKTLRDDFEGRVRQAQASHQRRDAIMDRAVFYLLWQGGMRLAEVEELRLEDLDFPGKRLSVRNGKGLKDRTVYLTETVMAALQAYLAMRGEASTDHVFLYRNYPLKKDLISSRMRDGGRRIGVKVYSHRLRHTCATQLLNAGCRITSIQRFLGHKKLNTTMIYARAHDQTVAEDYFTAMQRVEQRLEIGHPEKETSDEVVKVPEKDQLLAWVERLAQTDLCLSERLEIVGSLQMALGLSHFNEHPPPPVSAIYAESNPKLHS